MAGTNRFRSLAMIVPLAVACVGLSACGRDTQAAEHAMEAKQAAQRAEAAQAAVEQALARINRQAPVPETAVVEEEPEAGGDVRPDVDTETGYADDNPPPPQG